MKDIWRVGDPQKPEVAFGTLFDDDDVQQHYEGLAATLKAAKKREYIMDICIMCKLRMSCVAVSGLVFLTHYNIFQTNHRGDCYI